jgi:DNA-binding transcriptional LysR family regulator
VRIRHVEVFHAVMQARTVQGAADMLHITQPAATRLLQQAERHLGVPLFQRTRGRLQPTEEALLLYPEVERLYAQLEHVRRVAASLAKGPGSLLQVLCVPGIAIEDLPRALGEWNRRLPDARVTLRTLHSREIGESIALREAQVGFAFEPSPHPAVINEVVASGGLVCVGRGLPQAGEVHIRLLAENDVVDLDPSDPLGRLLHAAYHEHGVVPRSRATVHSYHSAIEMAAQGFGWAVVDRYTAAYAARYDGLQVLPLVPQVGFNVHALRPRDVPSSSAVDLLVACLRKVLER